MRRAAVIATLLVTAVSASTALAAAKPGTYRGTSSSEVFGTGEDNQWVDKGKVAFKVKGAFVRGFRLSEQEIQCGAFPVEFPVTVAKMRLNSKGVAKGTHTDENVGKLAVKVKVTPTGRARGTVTGKQLCQGVVKFTARRR